jgi:hypothetical protein
MSRYKGNTASNASDKPGKSDAFLTLSTSRQMLPLVRRILQDILDSRQRLSQIEPELATLERQRRHLAWPDRCRRYQLHEEVNSQEQHLQEAFKELKTLGVTLLDTDQGVVGFPTVVNGRRAFFSWHLGEEGLDFWQFAGESIRRTIPKSWLQELETPASPGRKKKH